jgi:hypothetical protein
LGVSQVRLGVTSGWNRASLNDFQPHGFFRTIP